MKRIIPFAALALFLGATLPAMAQTSTIGPNQYAFQLSINPNYGLFFNANAQRFEFLNGVAAPVLGIDANNGRFTTPWNLPMEAITSYPTTAMLSAQKPTPITGCFSMPQLCATNFAMAAQFLP